MQREKWGQWALLLGLLIAASAAASLLGLSVGSSGIGAMDALALLGGDAPGVSADIILRIRGPRVLLGFAVGGALSMAGAILQGVFRNPLVEPYTMGISGGASLGVCIGVVAKIPALLGGAAFPVCGFLGALAAIAVVYGISTKKGMLHTNNMLLTGVMISFIASSCVMLILAISRTEDLHGILFWIMGSLDQPRMMLVWLSLVASVLALLGSYFFCIDLNAFALGEEEAAHLGVSVERTKRFLFFIASLVTGISVSVAGIIGFVGLLVPHFIRMYTGPDYRILLAASFFGGATFLILCDMIARTVIAPMELPVGVITGIIGGIAFVIALHKRSVTL
jgi:iron complex transport system permease protein